MSHEIKKMMAEAGGKTEAYELSENIPVNTSTEATMGDVINQRYGRRAVLRGTLAVSTIGAIAVPGALMSTGEAEAVTPRVFFSGVSHDADGTHHVAEGYNANILIRWGDPVTPGAPTFDPYNQTSWAQEQQFGYNNDYHDHRPLPMDSNNSDHGLLFVNHEYTNQELMFTDLGRQDRDAQFADMTNELIDIEMSAHGGSIIEIKKKKGKWGVVRGSEYARRINTRTSAMVLSGLAASTDAMKTSAGPTGKHVTGKLNNCAGGTTPWGTVLTGEENIRGYFWSDGDKKAVGSDYARYGIPSI